MLGVERGCVRGRARTFAESERRVVAAGRCSAAQVPPSEGGDMWGLVRLSDHLLSHEMCICKERKLSS